MYKSLLCDKCKKIYKENTIIYTIDFCPKCKNIVEQICWMKINMKIPQNWENMTDEEKIKWLESEDYEKNSYHKSIN